MSIKIEMRCEDCHKPTLTREALYFEALNIADLVELKNHILCKKCIKKRIDAAEIKLNAK